MDDNEIEVFIDFITLYYTFLICGCLRYKGWKNHLREYVEIHYYVVDGLLNIEGAIPYTVKKEPIGIVEPTRCV